MYALHQPLNAYAKVGMETGVLAASPHQLIVMLFEGALSAIATAHGNLRAGKQAAKGQAISKAISIIDEGLRASLDKQAGGNIAAELDSLYQYMTHQLMQANLRNDSGILDEVAKLLRELNSAWEAIGQPAGASAAEPRYESQVRSYGKG